MKTASHLIVLALVGLVWTSVAQAQQPYSFPPYQRYQSPSGPALSPYLNFFRRDVGVLDQYRGLVSPSIQLRQNLAVQQYQLNQAQQQLRQVSGDVRQITESGSQPTGVGATFMNYSHYYPGLQR